ncbi:replicative DNA helicase [Leucobacter allii]|uniref:DNA 5'-3' helicase n=1 Tax=Leucobacter allii TaxID=2932247 RepID=A0ABY4FPJ5_9MICO|nr:replicative DNA helicase [Leucobacter allii]UOQ58119.1 replicative DNA helicase [Leucobacter allii]
MIEYDPLTEGYMLCAVFAEPSRVWEVRQIIRETDFAVPRNAAMFSIMCDVADRGDTVSPITVNDRKIAAGRTHEFTDAYTHEVNGLEARGYQAMQYAEIVRRHGERRKLHEAATGIQALAAAGDAEGDIVEKAAGLIADLRDGTLRQSRPIGAAFSGLVEEMSTTAPFTPTPWPSLNAMIGGIRPGSLYTVAARSGGGKSIFGLQLALHIAELGKRVGYVSLEMTEKDLLKRLISMMQGIHQSALQNHQLTEQGWASVRDAEAAVQSLPLEVFDRPGARWEDVIGFARALHRKGDLGLLVIDYLGLVKSPPGSVSRQQDLEDWANGGKQLAKELGCSVLILEQLNRNMTNRPNPRPIVSDLRGSAGLEHASDAVVLMHRGEKKIGGRVVKTSDVDFIVAKNRQGEAATRTLRFEGQFARIVQKEHETTALIEQEEV